MQKYQSPEINKIWSEEETTRLMESIWMEHLSWLETWGFKEAKQEYFLLTMGAKSKPSGHEVVDAINAFVEKTGLVNIHAGLTSSDVVDNVRLIQCLMSSRIIEEKLKSLINVLELSANGILSGECLGYTHMRPASRMTMQKRVQTWIEPLATLTVAPMVNQKPMMGATGTGEATGIILGGGENQGPILKEFQPDNTYVYALQSSYLIDELEQAQWLERIVGWLSKIALDIRFLVGTGELVIDRGTEHRGSSAMPGKQNPIEWEQICGLARLQPNYTRAIWDAMSLNVLERTLDNSSVMKVTLPAMYSNAAYILSVAVNKLGTVHVDRVRCTGLLKEHKEIAEAEYGMAKRIKNGESRKKVYDEMNGIK